MSEQRDLIDAMNDPDPERMNALLDEIGGIKAVVANNVVYRMRNDRYREDIIALTAALHDIEERVERIQAAASECWEDIPESFQEVLCEEYPETTGDLAPTQTGDAGEDERDGPE